MVRPSVLPTPTPDEPSAHFASHHTVQCEHYSQRNVQCAHYSQRNVQCPHYSHHTLCAASHQSVHTTASFTFYCVASRSIAHSPSSASQQTCTQNLFCDTAAFCCTNAHFYHTSRISHTLIFTLDAAEKNHYHINTNSILLSQFAVHLLWRRPASNVAEKGERIFEGHCILRGFGVGWYMEHMRYMGLVHGVCEVHEVGTWSVSTFVGHQGRSQWLKKLWPGIISDCHPSCRLRNLLFFSSLV